MSSQTAHKPVSVLLTKAYLYRMVFGSYIVLCSTDDVTRQVHTGNDKQKMWHMLDGSCVLPEYLVELQYLSHSTSQPISHATNLTVQEILASLDSSYQSGLIQQSVLAFANACSNVAGTQPTDEQFTKALNMLPSMSAREKHTAITDDVILSSSRTRIFANISYLNLHNNNIRKITGLSMLVNLKKLVLSFNEIQKIEVLPVSWSECSEKIQGLLGLFHLKSLDLGFNLIKRIENIQDLTSLEHLNLSNNLVYRLEDLSVLKLYDYFTCFCI